MTAIWAAAALTNLAFAIPATAGPNAGDGVDMNAQCANQYLSGNGYIAGQAYLVAPRDAYSWRCKRVSESPTGGLIADLPVNPAAYCAPLRATPAGDGQNWICTT